MSDTNYQHTCHVAITVLVDCSQPWPNSATIEEVQRRAAQEAIDRVQHALSGPLPCSCKTIRHEPGITIVGKPHVTMIATKVTK